MSSPVLIWGATGQSRVLADFLPDLGYRIVAFVDRNPGVTSPVPGIPLLNGEPGFREWIAHHPAPGALVAVGGDRGADRLALQELLATAGCTILTAVHPAATVAGSARIGVGSQILAGAVVGAAASLGAAVIINTRASADHECRLEDGVHLAPAATLCGLVQVGRGTLIGAGAVVLPRIRIGAGVVVGAGSVVTRDLPDNVIAFGNPARIVRARLTPGDTP
ncbi:MAG: NeuD/PglB/VioB family sugar acetyltransferase [Verrucomicrobiales bacterium]|nr:NeuD/PglB/VioB family sugar acetyltransferase [Verrucomicrobiales bacterium]